MRVLVVTNMYPEATAPHRGVFVKQQVEALSAAGVEVHVECIAGLRGVADYLLGRWRVARRVREFHPDVVHGHFGYSGLAALGQGLPSVLTLHGSDLRRGGQRRVRHRFGAELTRVMARLASRVIVQTFSMREDLGPRIASRVRVVPNGVDESLFCPRPAEDARSRLGVGASEVVLLFVDAGATANKRRDVAESVVQQLVNRGHQARLLVATGVRPPDMPWYYAAADVLLMTSDHEGSPMCVKEALACGTPVVSVPVGDVQNVIDSAERGAIAPRDPGRLADAVLAVSARLSPRRSLLPPRLRAESVAGQLIEIYDEVLAGRPRLPR